MGGVNEWARPSHLQQLWRLLGCQRRMSVVKDCSMVWWLSFQKAAKMNNSSCQGDGKLDWLTLRGVVPSYQCPLSKVKVNKTTYKSDVGLFPWRFGKILLKGLHMLEAYSSTGAVGFEFNILSMHQHWSTKYRVSTAVWTIKSKKEMEGVFLFI